jgi:hypothetical protein
VEEGKEKENDRASAISKYLTSVQVDDIGYVLKAAVREKG